MWTNDRIINNFNTYTMIKKDYFAPTVEVVEMGYRDPVCQGVSGTGDVPDYDYNPLEPNDLFNVLFNVL